jgi:hypothetical protein
VDDFINLIIAIVCAMVLGGVLHSTGLHEGYLQRARKWLEDLF